MYSSSVVHLGVPPHSIDAYTSTDSRIDFNSNLTYRLLLNISSTVERS